MTRLVRKFEDHIETLWSAVDGETDLRENHKLYSKVYRFYKKEGAQFTGDSAIDYNMVVDYLYEDLN